MGSERINRIDIHHLRNLTSVNMNPGPGFNILYGTNGSGKTSFLEALYFLNTGRSFRTRLVHRIIHHEADQFTLFAEATSNDANITKLGVSRTRGGESTLRVNEQTVSSHVEITKQFPLLLISPESHTLISSGPRYRRQFLDWGLFHVEQLFYPQWQRSQRALKQRNAALKAGYAEISIWDQELVQSALALHEFRENYIALITPIFEKIKQVFLQDIEVTLRYYAGWPKDQDLATLMSNTIDKDRMAGYTHYGPHRADLQIKSHKTPAQDILSKGQQKLVIYALRLAQGILLKALTGQTAIYLIDDLPAELDQHKRQYVIKALKELDAQVFITGTEKEAFGPAEEINNAKLFHVEHGMIREQRG